MLDSDLNIFNSIMHDYHDLYVEKKRLSNKMGALEDDIDDYVCEWLESRGYNTGVICINSDCTRVILTLDGGEELSGDDLHGFQETFGLYQRDIIKHYWCTDEGVPNDDFYSVDYIFKFSRKKIQGVKR